MLDTEKVKALRTELNLTQEQAAQKAGMGSKQHWNDIESGRKANVSIDTLNKTRRRWGFRPKTY